MRHARRTWPLIAIPLVAAAALAVLAGRDYGPNWFRYDDFALALAGFGTLALAIATFGLGREERLAREAEKLRADSERDEEERRRPKLTLLPDDDWVQSYAETQTRIYLRLAVENAEGTRASTGTRVLFHSLQRVGADKPTTFGSPYLGWTSAHSPDESVVIFPGATRSIDLGELRLDEGPRFRISLPGVRDDIPHERQYVPTGTTIRLVLGSDDAETRFYDVTVYWGGDAAAIGAQNFLARHVCVTLKEVRPDEPLEPVPATR
jgi:hypothetical protein